MLVYAHDPAAGARHIKASQLVQNIWISGKRPFISPQVLRELYNCLTQKQKFSPVQARSITTDYLLWRLIPETEEVLVTAFDNKEIHQLSLWDSIILASAQVAGAVELWTEDLNTGQNYGGVTAVNPLL